MSKEVSTNAKFPPVHVADDAVGVSNGAEKFEAPVAIDIIDQHVDALTRDYAMSQRYATRDVELMDVEMVREKLHQMVREMYADLHSCHRYSSLPPTNNLM